MSMVCGLGIYTHKLYSQDLHISIFCFFLNVLMGLIVEYTQDKLIAAMLFQGSTDRSHHCSSWWSAGFPSLVLQLVSQKLCPSLIGWNWSMRCTVGRVWLKKPPRKSPACRLRTKMTKTSLTHSKFLYSVALLVTSYIHIIFQGLNLYTKLS